MWQENLFNNLLVIIILGTLGLMIYCRITSKTIMELIKEIREAMSNTIE